MLLPAGHVRRTLSYFYDLERAMAYRASPHIRSDKIFTRLGIEERYCELVTAY